MLVGRLITLLLLCAFTAELMAAQIYRCKDNKGQWIFQQYACSEHQIADGSQTYQLWRTLRVQSSQAKKILSSLSGEVDSIKQCESEMLKFQQGLQQLQPKVTAYSRSYVEFGQAWQYLQECGQCRSSAVSNCVIAEQYLKRLVSKLTEY